MNDFRRFSPQALNIPNKNNEKYFDFISGNSKKME